MSCELRVVSCCCELVLLLFLLLLFLHIIYSTIWLFICASSSVVSNMFLIAIVDAYGFVEQVGPWGPKFVKFYLNNGDYQLEWGPTARH